MKKIRMGIWSEDPDYGGRIAAYIRSTEYRERISPVLFTDGESSLQKAGNYDSLDILLADEEWLGEEKAARIMSAGCKVVSLCGETVESRVSGCWPMAKYQPVNRMLDTVIQSFSEAATLDSGLGNGQRSLILAIYSAVGGAGKTTFAYTAAGLLARMGYRPAVLSLESVPSPCWRTQSLEDAFGRAVYESVKAPQGKQASLDSFFTVDEERNVRFLPASADPEELEQMGEEETLLLVESAASSSRTDTLILDLDSGLFPRTLAALKKSDKAVCLVPPGTVASEKTGLVLKQLEAKSCADQVRSMAFILNMSEGPPAGSLLPVGQDAEEILPIIQEWRSLPSTGIWNGRNLYHERLFYWLTELMKQYNRAPQGGKRL